jgi:hypothetical protein
MSINCNLKLKKLIFFLSLNINKQTCVPNGFVNTSTSPTIAFSGIIISFCVHTDVATPPTINHGLMTV